MLARLIGIGGGIKPLVQMGADFTATTTDLTPGPATASATFFSAGNYSGVTSISGGPVGDWLNDKSGLPGDAGNYEIQAVLVSGTTPTSGTMGVWLSLSSNRVWSNTKTTTVGSKTSTIDFTIRETADPTNQDTIRVTITATLV